MARRGKDEPPIDWQAIYEDYRKGDSSIREIARRHGINQSSINMKIARQNWTRDGLPDDRYMTMDEPVDDLDGMIELPKVKPQRQSVLMKRGKELAQRLLSEIEDTTAHHSEIATIIINTEHDALRRRAALKAISTDQRAKTLKEVIATLKMIEAPPAAAKTAKDTADKPEGKKAQRQEAAERAATSGVFAVPSPPKLVSSK
jgi:transposase-like protein